MSVQGYISHERRKGWQQTQKQCQQVKRQKKRPSSPHKGSQGLARGIERKSEEYVFLKSREENKGGRVVSSIT